MQFIVFFRPKMIFIVTEKHKNYHMKDEQLNKDGFKKFMKHEPCGFHSCKFSRSHNHIHCIRYATLPLKIFSPALIYIFCTSKIFSLF